MMMCWNGAIALVMGIVLEAAALLEFPNTELIAIGFGIFGVASFVCSVYWFSRPPCDPDDVGE
jgi:cobalamin synthase